MIFFKSINFKIIAFATILAAIFLTLIVAVILLYSRSIIIEKIVDETQQTLALYTIKLEDLFQQTTLDIDALSKTPPVQGVFGAKNLPLDDAGQSDNNSEEFWKSQLQDLFVSLAESKKVYHQLRLIDKSGQEVVRVDYTDGDAFVVPENQLQNKSVRPYFKESIKLNRGEVYVSSPNLNREGTPPEIEVPFVPVVRYALPIFGADGNTLGILIANVNISTVLAEVRDLRNELSDTGIVSIIDRNGFYVLHSNPSKEWGGPEDLNTAESFGNDYPNLLGVFTNREFTGEFSGQYVFSKQAQLRPNDQNHFLTVVKIADKNSLFAIIGRFSLLVSSLGLIFFAILFFVFLFFVKFLMAPLASLSYAVDKIGQGNFDVSLPFDRDDEIGRVAKAVNSMTEKLKSSYGLLEEKVGLKTNELSNKVEELENTKKAMMNVLEDVEGEKVKTENLANELLKFKQAVDATTDMIVITDPEGTVIYGNRSVKTLTGYDASEAIGKKAATLWKTPMPKEYYEEMWDTIKNRKQDFKSHVRNRRKDGREYDAEVTISPVLDKKGEIVFFVGIERDISREKEFERISQRLKLATESAHIGIWEYDIVNNKLVWDDNMYALYGIRKDQFSGVYDAWQRGLHPDDKSRGEQELQNAIEGKAKFDTEFRVVWPNGRVRYIKAAALVERDSNGKALRMIGVNWDITHDKEIDQAKSEFVSLASHQLRTPLSAINWYAEMLLNGDAGELNNDQKKYLQEIYDGNQRMVDLVNSLLNVSRLELGTFVVEPEPTNVVDLSKSVIEEQQPQLLTRKQKLTVSISDNLPIISVDPKLLRMVMQNLLSNAIKYTNEGGKISFDMQLDNEGKNLVIIVSDNGLGIPKEQQDKIFTKLFRADNVKESDTEGTGLGLYIVKSVVEHSGGSIVFESPYKVETSEGEKEEQGTRFTVKLPLTGMVTKKGTKKLD